MVTYGVVRHTLVFGSMRRIIVTEEQFKSIIEKWTEKYKKSIDCNNPKGFSQKAHCDARKARQRGEKTKSKSVSNE